MQLKGFPEAPYCARQSFFQSIPTLKDEMENPHESLDIFSHINIVESVRLDIMSTDMQCR